MPKITKETAAKVVDMPVAEDRSSDLEGYTISFVTIKEDHDLAPLLAPLPGGHCSCPHWGYLFTGRLVVTYGEDEEVIEPGDAFYMPPGHTPAAIAGSEFVMFSPAAELKATEEAMMAAMTGSANA